MHQQPQLQQSRLHDQQQQQQQKKAAFSSSVNEQKTQSPDKKETKAYNTSLTREDAHRFRATLDEAVERLDLLGLITADSLRRRKDPQTSRTRKDIYSLMRREEELEKMYEQLMHRRNELRGLANKSKYLQNQTELSEITAALKQSTSSITANLKDHPTIVGNLNKIQKDRASLNELLQMTSDELKEQNSTPPATGANGAIITPADDPASSASASSSITTPSYSYDTLLEQVARRTEEQRLLIETKLRQEKTSEALKKLEYELESEWNEYEKLEDIKNGTILELTTQLKHLKKVTSLTVKYEQQTSIASKETMDRLRANRLNELKINIARLKADLKIDKRVNKKSLVFLAKQKDGMDALYEEWETNYQEDYTNKSKEYEELAAKRQQDQYALVQAQQRWDEEIKLKVSLMKEMNQRATEEEVYRTLMDRMNLAQCTIRFYWRVYWRSRKKELKKLRRKKLARARAKAKAEKNRPPMFSRKQGEEVAAAANAAGDASNPATRSGTASLKGSKPTSALQSKPRSAVGSAKMR